MIDDMGEIDVVVAHSERVTIRVGDLFLKIDADQSRLDREIEVKGHPAEHLTTTTSR